MPNLIQKPVSATSVDSVQFANHALSITIAKSAGPRILAFTSKTGVNPFAELPGAKISVDGFPAFTVYGGHRFWLAPERPEVTYIPDDDEVEINPSDANLIITQLPVGDPAIQKRIQLSFPLPDEPVVVLEHTAQNLGRRAASYAPWAITQFKTGGIAILPQAQDSFLDEAGLMPNRSLVSWPYTDLQHPKFHIANDLVWLEADLTAPFKFGVANSRGWLAYVYKSLVFVKYAPYYVGSTYLDFGASSQCYCNEAFLELETLGPQLEIAPEALLQHSEIWEIIEERDLALDDPRKLVADLDLDRRAQSRLELLEA